MTEMVLHIRDIAFKDINTVHNLLNGQTKYFNVEFDDKNIKSCFYKDLLFTYYISILYNNYSNTPILYENTLMKYLENNKYNADTHIKLLEKNFKYICAYNNLKIYSEKEQLLKTCYHIVNLIYNNIVFNIGQYVTTIDAIDFIEVVNMPEIVEIHKELEPNPNSIEQAYTKIGKFLKSIDETENMFIHAYKSKTVNESQANQCIGPRGFVADIDRTVYKQPILSGFIRGLNTIYEVAVESRTAAKSHTANNTQIATSEYASRRLQLLTMIVDRVVPGDCGSTNYTSFYVQPGTIENLAGIYYHDGHELKMINGDEKELEDNFINIRSIFGCQLENPHTVCSTCLGELSNNFKNNSNLGNITVMHMMEKLSQSILSTKHLTHSVKNSVINLDSSALKYFTIKDDNLFIKNNIDTSSLSIILPSIQIPKLIDFINLTHNKIASNKIGELSNIVMMHEHSHKNIKEKVDISYNDRKCILTYEFLQFIKSNTIQSDNRGNFIIPLSKWNKSQPIFNMPVKEDNMITFVNSLATIIETDYKRIKDPYIKLDTLFTQATKKIKINLTVLQVIIYATTVYNRLKNDYSLSRGSMTPTVEKASNIHNLRSLSQLFAMQKQIKPIFQENGQIFNPLYREDHPMDVMFDPQAVIDHYYGK